MALVLLFEEWGWAPLAALFARIARLPLWAWVELKIAALPPVGALLVFGAPTLTLLPVKLLALYLFSHGKNGLGLTLLMSAKVGGTALMARLFHLTQPALMKIGWFAKWYPRWKAWKDALLEQVRQSALWRAARELKARARLFWGRIRGKRGPSAH